MVAIQHEAHWPHVRPTSCKVSAREQKRAKWLSKRLVAVGMRSVTALQMLEDGVGVRRLSFGCKIIDKCTRGGLPLQGINEIVGEAGAGKTQFALTLSLQCHLMEAFGGLSGATAYLCCGEGSFPVRRLEQLAHSFQDKSGTSYTEFMKSVYIEQCHNADDVLDTLVSTHCDRLSAIV